MSVSDVELKRGSLSAAGRWSIRGLLLSVSILCVFLGVVLSGVVSEWLWIFPSAIVAAWSVSFGSRAPKVALGMGVLLTVFTPTIEHLTGLSWVTYLDELAAVWAVLSCLFCPIFKTRGFRTSLTLFLFSWYVAAGVLAAWIHLVPASTYSVGTLLAIKPLCFLWAGLQLDWKAEDLVVVDRAVRLLACFCSVAGLLNLLSPLRWNSLMATRGALSYRFGLPALVGPFIHPGMLAEVLGLCALWILGFMLFLKRVRYDLLLFVCSLVFSLLGIRLRLIIALLVSIGLMLVLRYGALSIVTGVSTICLAAVFIWSHVAGEITGIVGQYLDPSQDAARTLLTVDSFRIALSSFPFGVGLGRFGSATAASVYSPVYVELGYRSVYGLSDLPGRGNWLTDTFWPSILGETGFLGLTFYGLALVAIVWRSVYLLRSSGTAWVRFIAVLAISWTAFSLVDSIASPVFAAPPLYAALFSLFGVVESLVRAHRAQG